MTTGSTTDLYTLVEPKSTIVCPVCGFRTSEHLCPYSTDPLASFNGKGKTEHETYNGMYSGSASNPYWDAGFRLGWSDAEISNIFTASKQLTNSQMALSSTHPPLDASASYIQKVFITENHVRGLTRKEVMAIGAIQACTSTSLPSSNCIDPDGIGSFGQYNIPQNFKVGVFDTFTHCRNAHHIIKSGLNKSMDSYRDFRKGFMRLMFRWFAPEYLVDFKTDNPIMFNVLSIKPAIAEMPPIAGFVNIMATDSDDTRRRAYKASVSVNGYERVFSQLYYVEMASAQPSIRRRIWGDIMWIMEDYDRPDIFGLPCYLFLPDNRLTRLMFNFSVAALKTNANQNAGLAFATNICITSPGHPAISSSIAPIPDITSLADVNDGEMWSKKYLIASDSIRADYEQSKRHLDANGVAWKYELSVFEEIYRRICGYSATPFTSTINSADIPADEVKSLSSGVDSHGNVCNMLNFSKALSLIAPYIADPSLLPHQEQPRYGILLCESCKAIYYASEAAFHTGCFDEVTPMNGMPISAPSHLIVLNYECAKCHAPGCREITVSLSRKCDSCFYDGADFMSFEFTATSLNYVVKCRQCSKDVNRSEAYDVDLEKTYFGTPPHPANIKMVGNMTVLTNPEDTTDVKKLEHPINLKNSIAMTTDEGGEVCPYEIITAGGGGCCQNMRHSWKATTGAPPQSKLNRTNSNATHKTVKVGESTLNCGTLVERYVCIEHKAAITTLLNNLATNPALNTAPLERGAGVSLSQIYAKNVLVPIGGASAKLPLIRVEKSRELMEIPLDITAVPLIAPDSASILDRLRELKTPSNPSQNVFEYLPGQPVPPSPSLPYSDSNALGLDFRHMFTFDKRTDPPPPREIPCDE